VARRAVLLELEFADAIEADFFLSQDLSAQACRKDYGGRQPTDKLQFFHFFPPRFHPKADFQTRAKPPVSLRPAAYPPQNRQ
jgi:hypothetical protein